ncbi:PREDICTED: golgin subfamily A member 6-like protein 22 isoform X1 [Camelina sativa]|uniref:Golgin subfamily A member 6-like protein 22 isoform X1 n=1 Tax=Camelina sativa TaxID=90675 RepID=A0ABM0SZF0_CAMSA|nr:PREDICTED: golgin subfamily A member 6-like protein 22 isoform X3 [Camelina sativa]XP_010418354.1 PREDICTED: golgin subfamily A member 6-like protein 22 isoform X2 [Camelina sativa]XP_019083676.1 PREDICTED: golgin subfamily A member 6-like protein 22 isoform X1 [Camelina sativa]
MFKSARWRNEKNRIKVVFRLKFHSTQASQFNTEGLVLSLVPGDIGKPTARSEKAIVKDGHCRWEIPVYETVKFLKDAKTGKVNQRIYHLIVSSTTPGSTRGGLVGETSIDFADYVDATKTCNVSLPLQNSNSKKALLHVSIQRQLEFDDPQRDVDECETLGKMSQGQDLKSHLSIGDGDETRKSDSHEEGTFGKAARFAELRRRASIESDSTMSSTGSVIEPNTPEEVAKPLRHPTKHLLHSAKNLFEEPRVSESEWSGSSDHGGISTDDSTNSSNDTTARDTTRNSSDEDEVEKLKTEVAGLTRQADLSEMELQSLRKQIVKETKRSQDLLREVNSLKQERDTLKQDCERHKVSDKHQGESKMRNRLQFEGRDPWILLEETREELDYEKDRIFNLRLQLQKTQESNSELILAVQDLEEMLEEKSKEGAELPSKSRTSDEIQESMRSETDEDEDGKALEDLLKKHVDAKDTHVLEQKITDLYNEIEIYKRDKDELEIQMEQLALDYEILKQENHDISYKLEQSQLQEQLKMQYQCSSSLVDVTELESQVESLETELKKQSEEFSESLCRIKELEAQMKTLEEEMEKQAQVFEADIDAVTRGKVEQEQRAIQAEETLRKTRWKNASVAGKLQDEFKRLSEQMDSMFTSNEKMAMKAMTEANELRMQKRQLEEMIKNANDELRANQAEYEAKIHELSEKLSFKTSQMEEMLESLDEKSNVIEKQKRHEEDVTANLNQEITMLKEEVEKLKKDKDSLVLQAEHLRDELEKTSESVMEAEASVQREKMKKVEVESKISLMRKESESLADELKAVKLVKDEKETSISLLKTELETVRAQCNDLKHSLSENDVEMEKHKKQVAQVKTELKKKEEAMANLEKKLKESRTAINNLTKTAQRSTNNNKGSPVGSTKEVAVMKDKIKLLEGQIKLKETALESSSNMFIEKEKSLKNRIEELETKLDQRSQEMSDKEPLNGQEIEDIRVLVAEIESLRESNGSMEMELKDMRERYSEISLRFAEVEGERQQLVMTVRNLKNAKRS